MGWFGGTQDWKGAVAAQERMNKVYEAQVEQTGRILERQEAAMDRYVALLNVAERLLGRVEQLLARLEKSGGGA